MKGTLDKSLKELLLDADKFAYVYKGEFRDGTEFQYVLDGYEGSFVYTVTIGGDKLDFDSNGIKMFSRGENINVFKKELLTQYNDDLKHNLDSKMDVMKLWREDR